MLTSNVFGLEGGGIEIQELEDLCLISNPPHYFQIEFINSSVNVYNSWLVENLILPKEG